MDNITHSIIGFGVGELVHRSLPREADDASQRVRHRLLLVSCALASNFPDLDLFLTRLLPDPLGYLLHHRGHTHTALLALPQALLLGALLWLCWPAARALLKSSRTARWGLAASIAIGFALHMLMDYTNSYGVHPWYPFSGRWFFGDMVFIVEPLFWVAIGTPMALIMRWRFARWLGFAGLFAALMFFASRGYLGGPSVAALLLALGVSIGFIAVQGAASQLGRRLIVSALHHADSSSRVLDVAMTAYPSQPLCWSYITVESHEAAGSYRLRRGVASVAPTWLGPLSCPAALVESQSGRALSPSVMQFETKEGSLAQLRALKNGNCQADAWLRFSRAPWLDMTKGELSDYRFALTPRGNFTTLHIVPAVACPEAVPGWGYPRQDLLSPRP
jgi:inner membrane protein